MTTVVTYAGLVLGTVFFVFYRIHPSGRGSGKILSLYVLFLSLAIAEPIFHEWAVFKKYEIWPSILGGLYFLAGPLLWVYSCHQVGRQPAGSKLWLHGIPFLVYVVGVILQRYVYACGENGLMDLLIYEILHIHIFSYFIVAYGQIASRRRLKNGGNSSDVSLMKLDWTKFLIIISICLFGFSFLISNVSVFLGEIVPESTAVLVQYFLLLTIIFIALMNTDFIHLRKFDRT